MWSELLGSDVRMLRGRYETRVLSVGAEGPPIVLLHGQGGSLENFRYNIPAYARAHHVVAVDLLWHGRSGTPPVDEALIPTWVDQVAEVIETLGIGPCHIEGQSLGGWVAATLALDRPELVRSLVLTTPMGIDAGHERPDPVVLSRTLAAQLAALRELTTESVRERMRLLFADPAAADDEIVEVRRQIYAEPRINAALRQVAESYLGGTATHPFRIGPERLKELTVPTLLYWGSANLGGATAGTELAAAIPGCEYHCADVGHWAQYERPDEHNRVVLDFVDRHPGTETS